MLSLKDEKCNKKIIDCNEDTINMSKTKNKKRKEIKCKISKYWPDKYPWERYEPLYPPSYGLNSTATVLLEQWLLHYITYKGWCAIKQRNQTKPIKILDQISQNIVFFWIILMKTSRLTHTKIPFIVPWQFLCFYNF